MNTEACRNCKGIREATVGWSPCSGIVLPPVLHPDPSSNQSQNIAVQKRHVLTEETAKVKQQPDTSSA